LSVKVHPSHTENKVLRNAHVVEVPRSVDPDSRTHADFAFRIWAGCANMASHREPPERNDLVYYGRDLGSKVEIPVILKTIRGDSGGSVWQM